MTRDDLGIVLARAASALHGGRTEAPTADAVVAQAVDLVPGAECASITIRRRGRYTTLAATHERAAAADRLQYETGEGPCVAAADHAEWIRSGDVSTDRRFPTWGPRAAEHDVGSLLSVSLVAREQRIGALNIYSTATGAFASRDIVDLGVLYGVHAAQAISSATLVSGLETALGSRHVIGVAQGMLVERFGLGIEQSFALLTRLSTDRNTRLVDIARDIVDTGMLPAEPTDGA